jgi:ribosomal protein L27
LNTFASSTPDTDSDSWVIAVMSESGSCVRAAIFRRTRPTRTWSTTNRGTGATATIVSCQLSSSIAISAATTVTTLPRDRDHPADQPGEQPEVDRRTVHREQGSVERGLREERGDDAQPARREHRDGDEDERPAVGAEPGPHAAAETFTGLEGRRRCRHRAELGTPPAGRRAAPPARLSPG